MAAKKKPSPKPRPKKDTTAFKYMLAVAVAMDELERQSNLESLEAPITEPPIDRDPLKLDADFRARLMKTLEILKGEGLPFKFHEGFRTVQRQQWLFGQGRPSAPFGHPGPKVTQKNGTTNLSNHQGNGKPGSGKAADCYPLDKNGKVTLSAPQSTWKRYAEVAESQGLTAGFRWTTPHDPPHVELR